MNDDFVGHALAGTAAGHLRREGADGKPWLALVRAEDADGHGGWIIAGADSRADGHRVVFALAREVGVDAGIVPERTAVIRNSDDALRAWAVAEQGRRRPPRTVAPTGVLPAFDAVAAGRLGYTFSGLADGVAAADPQIEDAAQQSRGRVIDAARRAVVVDGRAASGAPITAADRHGGVPMAPPAEWTWLELGLPGQLRRPELVEQGTVESVDGSVGGMLLRSADLAAGESPLGLWFWVDVDSELRHLPVEPRWCVVAHPVVWARSDGRFRAILPLTGCYFFLDERGHQIRWGEDPRVGAGWFLSGDVFPKEAYAAGDRWSTTLVTYMILALEPVLGLLNCRNIRLAEAGGRFRSRQERRAAERRGTPPPTRFYTLVLDPTRPRAQAEDPATGPRETRDLPLHLVRGHFARYTEDKPLFGRYAGTFWVPAHVRGTPEAGVIGKDYKLKGPAR